MHGGGTVEFVPRMEGRSLIGDLAPKCVRDAQEGRNESMKQKTKNHSGAKSGLNERERASWFAERPADGIC